MKRYLYMIVSIALVVLARGAHPVQAQWVQDGIPAGITTDYQRFVDVVEDGSGGIIMVWVDGRGATLDIYAQRIDGYGYPVWDPDGIPICTAGGAQQYPVVCLDGEGGAIFAWEDYRSANWDIYAQKVDADGDPQWNPDGNYVSVWPSDQEDLCIAPDGYGGAVIIWEDDRNGDWDIYGMRMNQNGVRSWTSAGVYFTNIGGHQIKPRVIEDGTGYAIVAWQDRRPGAEGIYAQRFATWGGVRSWTLHGVACCQQSYSLGVPDLVSDGYNGAIITWKDGRNGIGNDDIFAQRIDHEGNLLWGSDGTLVCSATGDQIDAVITTDGAHGAIIAWQDNRVTDNDVYAQRMNPTGSRLWGIDGIAVCTGTGYSNQVQITTDLDGGAVIAWQDARNGNNDLFSQRIYGDGALMGAGTPICTSSPEEQGRPRIVSDGSGGMIAAWDDYRSGSYYLIYAQRIERHGYWGYPAPVITSILDKSGDQGGWVRMEWNRSRLDLGVLSPIEDYSIWRMLPEEQTAMLFAEGEKVSDMPYIDQESGGAFYYFTEVNGTTYGWEYIDMIPADGSGHYTYDAPTMYDSCATTDGLHHFKVIAHTIVQTKFWESRPDSGYSVDNLAPNQPSGTKAEQSFNPEGLKLTWNANHEIDLSHYKIYRGDPEAMMLNREIVLATTEDTTYFDDEWRWYHNYYYKISAVDHNGNESSPDSTGRDDVTGDEIPPAPKTTYLDHNFPNPFNPATTILFGLKEPAFVSLCVYDVSGRLVRTLVSGERVAGIYKEQWNGLDNKRRAVASGVYFYRLHAGTFLQTKKMVLSR
jgi:hypothetical protein